MLSSKLLASHNYWSQIIKYIKMKKYEILWKLPKMWQWANAVGKSDAGLPETFKKKIFFRGGS